MKLCDITEGSLGDLVSLAAAKIGSKPEDRLLVKSNAQLFDMAKMARKFTYHLFDRRALPWWKEIFKHFNIPNNKYKDILAAARSEYYDRIDRSLFEADISKIMDLLNPRTRQGTVKSSARAATNEKLAIAVIGYISRAADSIGVGGAMAQAGTPDKKLVRAKALAPSQKKAMQGKIKKAPPAHRKEKNREAKIIAKQAIRSKGHERLGYILKLDKMGYKIDFDMNPPKLKRKA